MAGSIEREQEREGERERDVGQPKEGWLGDRGRDSRGSGGRRGRGEAAGRRDDGGKTAETEY